MTGTWQDIAAGIVVLAAVAYLARSLWQWAARPSSRGCGTSACGGCPSKGTNGPDQVVSIGPLDRPSRPRG